MNIQIRKANSADFESLKGLYMGLREHHNPLDETYASAEDYSHIVGENIEKDLNLPYSITLIALNESGEALGFGVFQVREKGSKTEPYGYIKKAYVKPELRGNGIFRKIYEEGVKWLKEKKVPYIELLCDSKNEIGLKNWESLGFGEVKKVMRKRLDSK